MDKWIDCFDAIEIPVRSEYREAVLNFFELFIVLIRCDDVLQHLSEQGGLERIILKYNILILLTLGYIISVDLQM